MPSCSCYTMKQIVGYSLALLAHAAPGAQAVDHHLHESPGLRRLATRSGMGHWQNAVHVYDLPILRKLGKSYTGRHCDLHVCTPGANARPKGPGGGRANAPSCCSSRACREGAKTKPSKHATRQGALVFSHDKSHGEAGTHELKRAHHRQRCRRQADLHAAAHTRARV